MHVLVTGGSGYIGSVLVPKLLNKNYKVSVVDTFWFGNNLAEHSNLNLIKEDIRNISKISLEGVDGIIHLANIANDPCGDLDPKLSWEVNVLAGKLLAEKAISSNIKRIVFASSGSVYGVKDEDHVTEDLSLEPISDYNKTKMVCERVLLSYKEQLEVKIIRPATVCGPSPRTRFDVSVNMFVQQAFQNGNLTVFGGKQTRPNIHIDDITDIFINMLETPNADSEIYNAGFENLCLDDIAHLVCKAQPATIQHLPSNDPRSYRLNSDKLLATGFKPKWNVEQAISQVSSRLKEGSIIVTDAHYNIKKMREIFGI